MQSPTRRDLLKTAAMAAVPPHAVPPQNKRYRIIDPHVHVWKKDPRYPWAKETRNPPDEDKSAEMLLDLMKRHGISDPKRIPACTVMWNLHAERARVHIAS